MVRVVTKEQSKVYQDRYMNKSDNKEKHLNRVKIYQKNRRQEQNDYARAYYIKNKVFILMKRNQKNKHKKLMKEILKCIPLYI